MGILKKTTEIKIPQKYKLIEKPIEQKKFDWRVNFIDGIKFKFTWRF